MDGGAWWAAVHGVPKSQTRLSDFTFTFHFNALEKEMATHSSVLAWRIPGMGEPGGLPSMGSHRVGHDWNDLAAVAAYCLNRRILVLWSGIEPMPNWMHGVLAIGLPGKSILIYFSIPYSWMKIMLWSHKKGFKWCGDFKKIHYHLPLSLDWTLIKKCMFCLIDLFVCLFVLSWHCQS